MASALVLSTLSFAAGVAGDLSLADQPNYGARVVVRIPPEIPTDSPRAAPLRRSLLSTSSAEAAQPLRIRARAARPPVVSVGAALVKAHHEMAEGPKPDPDRAPKPEEA